MRRAISRLPHAPGVYRFRDDAGAVLYIGRATTLRSRVASYWSGLRDRGHLAPMVARVGRVEAVARDSVHEAAWLERNLLETHLPPWNRTPGGQEVPVYLRLDARPQAPGLTVERRHQPGAGLRYFGPYLGGLRARQAAAAIGRVCPLAATGTGLSGAERDLARARGAAGADRGALAEAAAAILARDPAAVSTARAALEELRARAVQAPAFEVAGKISTEIQAPGLGDQPAARDHPGAGRIRGLRLVGAAAGPLHGPRWPPVRVVVAALRPGRGRAPAGRHAGRLGRLRAAERRAGRRAPRVAARRRR
jgi:excinuclease ABC subunit C